MPIDTSYLLGAQGVHLPDPMQFATQGVQLSTMASMNALRQIAAMQAARQQAAEDAYAQAAPGLLESNFSPESQLAAVRGAPPGTAGLVQAEAEKRQKAAADIQASQAKAYKDKTDAQIAMLKPISDMAWQLRNDPQLTPEKANRWNNIVASTGLEKIVPTIPFQSLPNVDAARDALGMAANMTYDVHQRVQNDETFRHNVKTELQASQTLAETQRYHSGELGLKQRELNVNALKEDPFNMSGLIDVAQGRQPGIGVFGAPGGAPGGAGVPGGGQNAPAGGIPAAAGASAAIQPEHMMTVAQAVQSGLTGQALMNALPVAVQGTVKQMLEGRMPAPGGYGIARSPYLRSLMTVANIIDPTFDSTTFAARQKARNAYAPGGPEYNNLKALDTATQHVGNLVEAYQELNNTNFPWLNALRNPASRQLGDPRTQEALAKLQTAANGVAGEMAKVFRTQGMSVQEIDDWKQRFSAAQSPAEQIGMVTTALEMMQARKNPMRNTWQQTFGPNVPFPTITPEADQVMQAIQPWLEHRGRYMQPESMKLFHPLPPGGVAGSIDIGNGFSITPAGQ